MDFSNRQNESVTVDGKTHWISRSVAVVVIPIFRLPDNSFHIPVGVRSATTPDHQGKLGLVCGYLDWDESGIQACLRESWEELGLDLSPYDIGSIQPYFVQTDPSQDDRQNITLRYRFMVDVEDLPLLSPSAEVESSCWIQGNSLTFLRGLSGGDFAFNHADLLIDAFSEALRFSKMFKHNWL
jgi:8-oxo-dGTP pyrophosphatase MutT (NUDIX family)